ncbi:MAG TPA: cupredoxin domain-containing protein [Beijerinckiaceae bacterium]|nr:cupredoxin domain-containing protein [Rhodoblastus sp.]MCB9998867.1 cupredoxin domain-containing protein [Methylobacteriaceae bacterium]MCC0002669.1 cupredoxin domain-containing protein [Methylobacteriaceae bacterium]HPG03385.1 cupredoxin domain-containing protein [Rhodoblastus sp.]HRY03139.1 cupredoxin domain-containing protein [Beijerinckiaceae bacterium]
MTYLRFAFLVLALVAPHAARAEEPTFQVVFENGKIEPLSIEVPAKTRIRLELINKGDSPAEFESKPLRLEKVLAPHSQSVLVIRTLDPGEYPFFDDFHPNAPPAVVVAREKP